MGSGTVSLVDTATWSVSQSRWGKTEAAWPLPGRETSLNLREQGAARLEKIAKTSKLSGDAVRALLDF
jgi:phage gp37-like protein